MTSESQPDPATSSEPAPLRKAAPAGAPADPRAGLRASHADREAVAERLREAAGEGRLDMEELEERLELALTARTYGELIPLTADLPGPHQQRPVPLGPPPSRQDERPLLLKGGLHGAERVGRWQVPSKIIAKGGMGGVKVDFTRTELPLGEVEVEVHGEMAGVTVVVPEGWRVDTSGVDPSIGGLRDRTSGEAPESAPTVWVTGSCGMGGATVRHPNRWERRKLRDNPA
ncbi:DUF1707 domain-containing protein [Streptomyces sp. 3MP-14]|uniref:DUF1707 domain-containing protein n=1 Tax=Streptomyces mimosae TaxID=2586635 RepID=A0A5N6AHI4_9ACTN|nr:MULTISPECIES: DUF1707 domain-containing protein [Streptomyces]KAB8167279.1 DUF1707 domain-containing protein [Streptomyces mimosae]KAB8177219.1 DUF1707 domain-containing protein [Streptomyces sp. 3MP-14]